MLKRTRWYILMLWYNSWIIFVTIIRKLFFALFFWWKHFIAFKEYCTKVNRWQVKVLIAHKSSILQLYCTNPWQSFNILSIKIIQSRSERDFSNSSLINSFMLFISLFNSNVWKKSLTRFYIYMYIYDIYMTRVWHF